MPTPSMSELMDAMERLEMLRADVADLFSRYDLLLCPTSPVPAHPHDPISLDPGDEDYPAPTIVVDGREVAGRNSLRATIPADLTGSPAMSVPFGWSGDGLPIGVQLVSGHLQEGKILNAAGRHPPV